MARGEANETEVRETLSELAVADVIGRNKDGAAVPAGSVSAALDAAIRDSADRAAVRELGKVRSFIRAVRAYFRALFGTVAALRKARRDGGAADFDALIAKIVGTDGQLAHDRARMAEAEAMARDALPDYVPPTEEELANGVAFSVRRKLTQPEFQTPAEAPDVQEAKDIGLSEGRPHEVAAEGRKWLEGSVADIAARLPEPFRVGGRGLGKIGQVKFKEGENAKAHFEAVAILPELLANSEPVARFPDSTGDKAVAFMERRYAWATFPDGAQRHVLLTARYLTERKEPPRMYSVEALEVRNASEASLRQSGRTDGLTQSGSGLENTLAAFMAGVKPEHRQSGASFRLSAGSRYEAMQNRIDAALARDPEARRRIGRRASEKLQTLQFNAETLRFTGKGDEIRPLVEKRTSAELDKEQAMRQALQNGAPRHGQRAGANEQSAGSRIPHPVG